MPGLSSDQINIVTFQLAADHPEEFSRDPFFGSGSADFYPVVPPRAVGWLTDAFGIVGGHRVAQLPLMVAYLVIMYAVLHALTGSAPAALLVAMFSCQLHESMGASYWGLDRVRAVQPRSFVLLWMPLLLLVAWRWRRGRRLLAVFAALGLLVNISPPGALFFAGPLWLALLMAERPTKADLGRLALAGVALTLAAGPFVYHHLAARAGNPGGPSPEERQLFTEALAFRSAHMSSFPVPREAVESVLGAFAVPLVLGAAGWMLCARRRGAFDRTMLVFFLITAVGLVAAQYLMQKVCASLQIAPPVINIHRGQKNAYLILYIYAAALLANLLPRVKLPERHSVIAVLAMIVTALPLIGFWRIHRPRRRLAANLAQVPRLLRADRIDMVPWYESVAPVADWVRRNTPRDSLVLFGHRNMGIFRVLARRAIVGSRGAGGVAIYSGYRDTIRWYRTQRVLEKVRGNQTMDRHRALADETGADYIIVPPNIKGGPGWRRVHEAPHWNVFARAEQTP